MTDHERHRLVKHAMAAAGRSIDQLFCALASFSRGEMYFGLGYRIHSGAAETEADDALLFASLVDDAAERRMWGRIRSWQMAEEMQATASEAA